MGTDIHVYTEYRNQETGEWHPLYPLQDNPYWNADDPDHEDGPEWDMREHRLDRNYGLFAILADVRNGAGFAGVDTGDPIEPIDMPRGWPDDLSAESVQYVVPCLEHTPTWFSLEELQRFDWDHHHQVHRAWCRRSLSSWNGSHPFTAGEKLLGYENPATFALAAQKALNEVGYEQAWDTLHLDMCGRSGEGQTDESRWRTVEWVTTFRESAGQEWFDFLDEIQKDAQNGDIAPQDVRFIIYFDS